MPGAGELDLGLFLKELESTSILEKCLSTMERLLTTSTHNDNRQTDPQQMENLALEFEKDQPDLFRGLLSLTYKFYYQDDQVRQALGLSPGPPFPRGNEVEPGDLSLLAQVKKRGQLYRN